MCTYPWKGKCVNTHAWEKSMYSNPKGMEKIQQKVHRQIKRTKGQGVAIAQSAGSHSARKAEIKQTNIRKRTREI